MVKTLIEEGDHVIFKREEGSSRVFQIRSKRKVYFSKLKFGVEELIGQPYGSTFELERGKLTKVTPDVQQETAESFAGSARGLDQSADNRNLTDKDSNQNLSKEDIMKMKDEGIAGEKIIEELIENSETFKSKTEFSQAKYLKKKKKKHMLIFTVYQPSLRLIMEMYAKEPGKLNFLRPDSLSQLLCYSNVMYGSRVAVMETSQGLVVGGLLQRLGGSGKLIQLIPNIHNPPCRQIVDYFSFPKDHLDNLYTFPLDQLWTLKADQKPTENGAGDGSRAISPNNVSSSTSDVKDDVEEEGERMEEEESGQTEAEDGREEEGEAKEEEEEEVEGEINEAMEGEEAEEPTPVQEEETEAPVFVRNRDLQRQARAIRQKEAGDIIRQKQLDSLVIACKQNPVPVLSRMLEFMGLSRPVVVFSQYIDPLIECYTYVKENHVGIQLRLWDSWFREYQVLPQRTHPAVNMSGTGGYLLTFLTTEPSLQD